ncbi:hypothetical protein NQD34_004809 [Periophthalmus magnuspinnatus]|uniref:UPF0688 protein C1orf174 homolog n=1 Tax=Periophthalmus magnuspinnatus TaxID=409849 RepID=UPI00145BB1BA|nr:UPF0688 protein C1orf174 homolog [Periophthalmus magnuspinnatus]KAJ0036132.1 hypothetical protein NQD34_004809 [Periophthalmus magnuspinnatus]
MPGQLRSRKRKSSSQSRGTRKVYSSQKSKVCLDRSGISCECEQWSDHKRCSASPQPVPHHDKENQQEALCCGERMDYQDYSKLFLDEDSNQILPVEHFFGNMDAVQDFPQRPSAPSTTVSRAQRRRRYFALEDSEEEEEEEEGEVTKRREEGEREEPEQPEQHPEESPSDRH